MRLGADLFCVKAIIKPQAITIIKTPAGLGDRREFRFDVYYICFTRNLKIKLSINFPALFS